MSDQQIDQLRAEAARQRQAIARDIDLVEERVSPTQIADRQRARWRQRVTRVRYSVFGTPATGPMYVTTASGDSFGTARTTDDEGSSVTERASDSLHRIQERTPDSLGEFTEGNPLAAGLVGMGVGMLAATLLPSSREEQRHARQAQESLETAATAVARAGKETAERVKPTAQEAAESVKESARESVENVKADAASSTESVRQTAQERSPGMGS
jgi:hypothetical protein